VEISKDLVFGSRTFWIVTALFLGANAWSWLRHRQDPLCCDQEITVGFPVPFHISGGIAGASNFYPLGLLLDIVIFVTVALTATWIARLLGDK
jgi:hypothetical protein